MAKKKKRSVVYYAEGMSPDGEGMVRMKIKKKDVDFFKVRGYKIRKKYS